MLSRSLWEIEIPAIVLLWPHPWSLLEKLFTAKKWRLGIGKYYELVKYRSKRAICIL